MISSGWSSSNNRRPVVCVCGVGVGGVGVVCVCIVGVVCVGREVEYGVCVCVEGALYIVHVQYLLVAPDY